MSISYYGLPVRDEKLIGDIVEGRDTKHAIDATKVRGALAKGRVHGAKGTVLPNHVLVTHNAGRSSTQLEVVLDVLDALRREGLHVYDPQQGAWFFKK